MQSEENFAIFTLIYTDTKLLHRYEHFFSFFSPTNIMYLKGYPHNLAKYEIKGTSKTPISLFFSELGKIWKHNTSLHSKNPIFHLFQELGKIERSS